MKLLKTISAGILITSIISCGVARNAGIRKYIPQSKFRQVVVMPFKTSSSNAQIGAAAADVFVVELEKLGFTIMDRVFLQKVMAERGLSESSKTDDILGFAKSMGVAGIFTGNITEAGDRIQKTAATLSATVEPTTYNSSSYDRWGQPREGQLYAQGEGEQAISKFSATAQLMDASNGSIVWSGSGSDTFTNSTIQSVAQSVLRQMAIACGNKLKSMKY